MSYPSPGRTADVAHSGDRAVRRFRTSFRALLRAPGHYRQGRVLPDPQSGLATGPGLEHRRAEGTPDRRPDPPRRPEPHGRPGPGDGRRDLRLREPLRPQARRLALAALA